MRFIIALFLASLICLPAAAQSRKELAAQAALLEQRVTDLENRFLTGDPAAERLMRRMDALETEQSALRGEVEQLRYERDQTRKDMEVLAAKVARWEAMEERLIQHLDAVDIAAAEAARAPAVDPWGAPQTGPVDPALPNAAPGTLGAQTLDMGELLELGQNKLLSGDFAGAELAYQQYVNLNPEAEDVDVAHYWLGETYIVRGRFPEAAESFGASLKINRDGAFAPAALVGLAASMRNMGNTKGACDALAILPLEYPQAGSDVSAKADSEAARAGC